MGRSTRPAPASSMWCRGPLTWSASRTTASSSASPAPARMRSRRLNRESPQADLELAGGGHACPVAAVAEVLGHGPDEAHPAGRSLPGLAHVMGRAPAALVVGDQRDALLGEERLHPAHRHRGAAAEGHELDEAGRGPAAPGVPGERSELVLVDSREDHRVDVEAPEAGRRGGVEAAEDAPQVRSRPAQPGQASGVEGVERHVERAHARLPQRPGQVAQPVAVGGERHLLDPRGGARVGGDRHQLAAQRRLAAGQADPPHPQAGEDPDQPGDLGPGEEVAPLLVFRGRAVAAAEVAAIGEGEAEVGDDPPVAVDQRPVRGNHAAAPPCAPAQGGAPAGGPGSLAGRPPRRPRTHLTALRPRRRCARHCNRR